MRKENLRNICIIAHVDHGKTTLVDYLLRQAGVFRENQDVGQRIMDSGDLEREKGITISAKNAAITYKDVKINIVDTPGHADFGGEVERILGTADGAILLVDAFEGPLPQTRFVLERALRRGQRVILCINKVDRPDVRGDEYRRINQVIDHTFDLFVELGASDDQCQFPIFYTCAREGFATSDLNEVEDLITKKKPGTLKPLFDAILEYIPAPEIDEDSVFKLQISNVAWSDYFGQMAIGRIFSGVVQKNQDLFLIPGNDPTQVKRFQAARLFSYQGLATHEVDQIEAGDIGMIAGLKEFSIGDTIASDKAAQAFPPIAIEPPTLKMAFTINSSPLAGKEGEAVQSRKLKDRLLRECLKNVALSFEEDAQSEQFFVFGRGELQFAVFIETLRREGLEFMVGKPQVMFKTDEKGEKTEPIELVTVDLPEWASGDVTNLFQERKGKLTSFENLNAQRARLIFEIPTRGLIGLRSQFLTATKGEGLLSSELKGYEPMRDHFFGRKNGTLISDRAGKTTDYALKNLEDRGVLFVRPQTDVYEGMVIGECARGNDMNVNPVRPKKLTNVRTTSSDGLIILAGVREMSLEQLLEWVDDDEWIEITPQSVRVRKKILACNQRSVIRNA